MTTYDLTMRGTIWFALALYVAGEVGRLAWRSGRGGDAGRPRLAWALGIGFYLLHVVLAFGGFHGWSHAAAYDFTAQQTESLVGMRWGGGIYLNHLFTAVWLAEIIAWWCAPERYRRRAGWIDQSLRLFFAFMIVNGAVIFVAGPQRWLGTLLVAILLAGFCKRR
ncbi:MAG: hypothetical protein ACI9UA_003528 [Pseudoalteromonas tetraodonis]|jgi:hypothetical protein